MNRILQIRMASTSQVKFRLGLPPLIGSVVVSATFAAAYAISLEEELVSEVVVVIVVVDLFCC